MTFPAVQTKVTTSASLSSPFNLNLPTGIAADDILVTSLFRAGNNPQTITWPSGWTQLFTIGVNAASAVLSVAWRHADGTEGSTISVSSSRTGAQNVRAICYRIDFASATSGIETNNAISGSSANPPSLTPSWGAQDTLWIAVGSADSGTLSSYPAGYTGDQLAVQSLAMATRQLHAASEDPANYVFSGGSLSDFAAVTIAIKPAPAVFIPSRRRNLTHLRR